MMKVWILDEIFVILPSLTLPFILLDSSSSFLYVRFENGSVGKRVDGLKQHASLAWLTLDFKHLLYNGRLLTWHVGKKTMG